MYNSAGRFSTPFKTFSSRRVFRPFIEQGASPPVLWSRGASPPSSRGCLFSPVALASAVIIMIIRMYKMMLMFYLAYEFKAIRSKQLARGSHGQQKWYSPERTDSYTWTENPKKHVTLQNYFRTLCEPRVDYNLYQSARCNYTKITAYD